MFFIFFTCIVYINTLYFCYHLYQCLIQNTYLRIIKGNSDIVYFGNFKKQSNLSANYKKETAMLYFTSKIIGLNAHMQIIKETVYTNKQKNAHVKSVLTGLIFLIFMLGTIVGYKTIWPSPMVLPIKSINTPKPIVLDSTVILIALRKEKDLPFGNNILQMPEAPLLRIQDCIHRDTKGKQQDCIHTGITV